MCTQIQKAFDEYRNLPEVMADTSQWDQTIEHLVYWAQHEIDLVEEGDREEYPMPKANERKLRAFISKWTAAVAA